MSDSSPALNLDNPVDVLNAAANHLDRVGLAKEWFWDLNVQAALRTGRADAIICQAPCCVLGAIRTVMGAFAGGGTKYSQGYDWSTSSAYKALVAEAETAPADLNDKPETTKEDMVALLRRAAVRAASMETK